MENKKDNVLKLGGPGRSSTLVSPRQLLEMVIEEIDSGKLSPNRAIIIMVSEEDDDSERISGRWSNMDVGQSVYYLNKALYYELHGAWE